MKKTPYSPIIVASIILLASVGAFALEYYVLSNGEVQLTDITKQIKDKKFEIEKADQARNALTSLDANEALVKSYVLRKDNIVPFIDLLQSTGKEVGASVQVLSVTDDKSTGHARVVISLTVNGSFDAVMRTMGILENGPYDTELTNLALDSAATSTRGTQLWSANTALSVGIDQTVPATPTKP
jgi:hypothetical protein